MSMSAHGARLPPAGRPFPPSTIVPSLLLAVGLMGLAGCGDPPRVQLPSPAEVATAEAAAVPGAAPSPTSVTVPPAGAVEIATLVELARHRHPTAQAVAASRRAAEARAAQAGTWANPEVELSYGRSRPRVTDQDADRPYGARLSQRLEWWSKRSARVAVANAQLAAVEADAAADWLAVEVEVRLAAIALATAQQAAVQTGAQEALARELAEVVMKRQALGDIDRGEAARIRLEATTARLRHEAALRTVALQREELRAWCGEAIIDDLVISDALGDPRTDAAGVRVAAASAHPRIRAASEGERAAQAQADAERQARIPDITIGVFGDREWEQDTVGVSLGFAIPLWDRNAARIAEAEADRSRRAAERAVAVLGLERERIAAQGEWTASAADVIALRDQAIPVAEEALRLRTSAFQSGDASLGEVLDARRAALVVQAELLAARRRHAEAGVRLLAASGQAAGPAPVLRGQP